MGLFSKKKKKKLRELPLLPEEKPAEASKEFPVYEPQLSRIEHELGPKPPTLPIEKPKTIFTEEKPIYIKIDKYKSAIKTLEEIKSKLIEAEKILNNLRKLKNEENEEFENWRSDIEEIKEKLLSVDKNLFEI